MRNIGHQNDRVFTASGRRQWTERGRLLVVPVVERDVLVRWGVECLERDGWWFWVEFWEEEGLARVVVDCSSLDTHAVESGESGSGSLGSSLTDLGA